MSHMVSEILRFVLFFLRLYTMIFLLLSFLRKGEALSALLCASAGSLVPIPLCSGSFPEDTRREMNLSCAYGSAGGRAVGGNGGRSRVKWCGEVRGKAKLAGCWGEQGRSLSLPCFESQDPESEEWRHLDPISEIPGFPQCWFVFPLPLKKGIET